MWCAFCYKALLQDPARGTLSRTILSISVGITVCTTFAKTSCPSGRERNLGTIIMFANSCNQKGCFVHLDSYRADKGHIKGPNVFWQSYPKRGASLQTRCTLLTLFFYFCFCHFLVVCCFVLSLRACPRLTSSPLLHVEQMYLPDMAQRSAPLCRDHVHCVSMEI